MKLKLIRNFNGIYPRDNLINSSAQVPEPEPEPIPVLIYIIIIEQDCLWCIYGQGRN